MNKRDRVIRAINFENPDKVPLWLFNKDQEQGDILWYDFRIQTGGEESIKDIKIRPLLE